MCNPNAGAQSDVCSRCCSVIISTKRTVNAGGIGICASCEETLKSEAAEAGTDAPPTSKSWEDHCLDELAALVTHPPEMRDSMTQTLGSSLKRRRGECDTTKQRRPDLLYLLRHADDARIAACILVEIDEHSHFDSNYTPECELGKIDDTFQALCKLGQRDGFAHADAGHARPDVAMPVCYFFKLNPNAFDGPTRVSLPARLRLLADRVRALHAQPRASFFDMAMRGEAARPIVETFFYHSLQGARHLTALAEAGEARAIDWRGNRVSV